MFGSPNFGFRVIILGLFVLIDPSESSTLAKVRCDPSGECKCPENPLTERYPDPKDPTCQHYYLCHLGKAFKKVCDVRTAFHPKEDDCMPRQRIPDKYCEQPVKCPLWTNRYVEDPQDCTKYYLCFYQRPSHYGCPEGNYYDSAKQQCIHDEYQAEACQQQELADKEHKMDMKHDSEISTGSTALQKAKDNARALHNSNDKIVHEDKPFISSLEPIGDILKG